MQRSRPFGIDAVAFLNIVAAVVLIWTLFGNSPKLYPENIGMSERIGLLIIPETITRIFLAVLYLVEAVGLVKHTKWGFWLFEGSNAYLFFVSMVLCIWQFDNVFFGNMITALLFFLYIYFKRQYFLKPKG